MWLSCEDPCIDVLELERTGWGRGGAHLTITFFVGGKYTWGSVMDRDGDEATDPRDPNYDSGNEQNGVSYHLQLSVQIKMYKQSVRASGQQPATEPTTLNMQLMSV